MRGGIMDTYRSGSDESRSLGIWALHINTSHLCHMVRILQKITKRRLMKGHSTQALGHLFGAGLRRSTEAGIDVRRSYPKRRLAWPDFEASDSKPSALATELTRYLSYWYWTAHRVSDNLSMNANSMQTRICPFLDITPFYWMTLFLQNISHGLQNDLGHVLFIWGLDHGIEWFRPCVVLTRCRSWPKKSDSLQLWAV